MDEFDANTMPADEAGDTVSPTGTSRRTFLKAAVVGSAAAVAVGGAGAAALTLAGRPASMRPFAPFVGGVASLSGVTGDACTTNSADGAQSTFGSDSIYFWAKFNTLPAGQYTIGVTPKIDPNNTPWTAGLSGLDFNSKSNCANVYVLDAKDGNFTCNPSSLPDPGSTQYSGNTVPITFTVTDGQDALLQLHIKAESGFPGGVITITATLYTGSSVIVANTVESVSAQITIS